LSGREIGKLQGAPRSAVAAGQLATLAAVATITNSSFTFEFASPLLEAANVARVFHESTPILIT
jgi:hypothetical protein